MALSNVTGVAPTTAQATQTDLEIINRALLGLSETPLENLDGTDHKTTVANAMWPQAVNEVFAARVWAFALQMESRDGAIMTDAPGWYRYDAPPVTVPGNRILRPYRVRQYQEQRGQRTGAMRDDFRDHDLPWSALASNAVMANEAKATIYWCIYVANVSEWPPWFETAVEYNLADRMCMPLTKNLNLKQVKSAEYHQAMGEASAYEDAQGRSDRGEARSITSRWGGYGWGW